MIGESGRGMRKRRLALLSLAVAAGGASGCAGADTPAEPTAVLEAAESTPSEGARAQIVSEMLESITLSDEQRQAVEALLNSPQAQPGQPGAAWYLAAGLEEILTSEQVESLVADLDVQRAVREEERRRRRNGEKAREPGVREGREEQRRERRSEVRERRELARAAMRDALGLTDEQVAALEALRADRPDRGEARESREERREAVAAILTEAQLRAVRLHRVLVAGWLHGHRGSGEGAHRHRRSRPETAP